MGWWQDALRFERFLAADRKVCTKWWTLDYPYRILRNGQNRW